MSEQNPNVIDTDKLSLEEIRQLAEKELRGETPEAPKAQPEGDEDQPRDDKGRFLKTKESVVDYDPAADENDPDGTPDRKLYRRVIDVGGDAGAEIFEAESLEELVDKIAEAKKHATKKIREQELELRKYKTQEAPKAREFNADEEYIFSQEMLKSPTKAVANIFKELTGYEISQFGTVAKAQAAAEKAQEQSQAIASFLTTHTDYEDDGDAGQKNGLLMSKWMGEERTVESFEKAYQDLKSRGLLTLKGKEAHADTEPTPTQERIAPKVEQEVTPQRTKKESGLSTRNRSSAAPKSSEPSEDDLYKLPMDQLAQLANRELAKQR